MTPELDELERRANGMHPYGKIVLSAYIVRDLVLYAKRNEELARVGAAAVEVRKSFGKESSSDCCEAEGRMFMLCDQYIARKDDGDGTV